MKLVIKEQQDVPRQEEWFQKNYCFCHNTKKKIISFGLDCSNSLHACLTPELDTRHIPCGSPLDSCSCDRVHISPILACVSFSEFCCLSVSAASCIAPLVKKGEKTYSDYAVRCLSYSDICSSCLGAITSTFFLPVVTWVHIPNIRKQNSVESIDWLITRSHKTKPGVQMYPMMIHHNVTADIWGTERDLQSLLIDSCRSVWVEGLWNWLHQQILETQHVCSSFFLEKSNCFCFTDYYFIFRMLILSRNTYSI